jgi:hypothetical protein
VYWNPRKKQRQKVRAVEINFLEGWNHRKDDKLTGEAVKLPSSHLEALKREKRFKVKLSNFCQTSYISRKLGK